MLNLHARVKGAGQPLILLHGLFGSLENLAGIAKLLTDDFQVHMLDMRNHGRSPHHAQMSYPLMAEDVRHYMDANALPYAHVLGHSMGGKAAMQLALLHPERIANLIVADIAPVNYPPHHDAVFKGLNVIDPHNLRSRQEADELLKPHVPEIAVRSFLLKNLLKQGAEGFTWRMNLTAINHNYSQIMTGQHHDQPFTGPTLFIKGELSDYIKPQYRDHTMALFPEAQVRVMPNSGHWLHAEKPGLFASIVKRFLSKA